MRTLQDCLNDLADIEKLEVNWNGYNAMPIPIDVINQAKHILSLIPPERKYPDRVLPTARETIHIEWEYFDSSGRKDRSIYFEIEVYADKYTILLVQGDYYLDAVEITLPIQV